MIDKPPPPIRRVGFVGLGRMGWPMAGHLLRAGFELTVHDVRADRVTAFVAEHGGAAAGDLPGAGRGAEAVVTMLPTSADVAAAVLGIGDAPGIVEGLAPGAVIIDTGSSDPVQTRELGARLRARGVDLVDAPVAGGVVFAEDGTLDVMVGGDPAVVERCRPVLDAVGRRVQALGGLGNAHAMKSLNNFVNASALATLLEALTVGQRLGLDIDTMIDSLAAATTERNHPLVKKVLPHVLTRRFAAGGPIGIIAKDVHIALAAAEGVGAFAPVAKACVALWDEAAARYGAERDQTEIVRLWEERTGVRLEKGS